MFLIRNRIAKADSPHVTHISLPLPVVSAMVKFQTDFCRLVMLIVCKILHAITTS